MTNSKLTGIIRPLTLLFLLACFFVFAMMSACHIKIDDLYVTMLKTWGEMVFTMYFVGRSAEKVIELKSPPKTE